MSVAQNSNPFYPPLHQCFVLREFKTQQSYTERKKVEGFCCHTSESNSGPPAQKVAYQSAVLWSPHPPPPPAMLGQKNTHFHPWCSKFIFVWGGRGGVASFTNTTGKVPMLLTSIVAKRKQFKPQLSVACMFMSKTYRLASSVFCISHSVARFCFS